MRLVDPGKPMLSVVINNHNYARYLGDAIQSALAQTWRPLEVIVVDDGSSDASSSVINTYLPQVRSLLKPRGGQASALNAGAAMADGAVIIFLDADDMLHPNIGQRVMEAWANNPHASKFQYHLKVVDGAGRLTGETRPLAHVTLLSGDLKRHYLTFPDDIWRLPTSGNAFPAALLSEILPIPEAEYEAGADTYLTHMAPLLGEVVTLGIVGGYYRIHGANGYESADREVTLARVYRNIGHSAKTRRHIAALARRTGLDPTKRAKDVLSISLVANRMISVRLDHPAPQFPSDTRLGLVVLGMRATMARFDITLAMRMLYFGWFLGMGLLSKRAARWLAGAMMFPDRRPWLNRYIQRWTRPQ